MLKSQRRPFIAAIFSFFCPGLGQLYCGSPRRAIAFFGLTVGWGLLSLTPFMAEFAGFAAILTIGLLLSATAIIDAVIRARNAPKVTLRRFNHWAVYAAVFAGFMVFGGVTDLVRGIETYSMASGSGLPNLRAGDRIVVESGILVDAEPARGDLVVYRGNDGSDYIHRVVALGGDRVSMENGILHLNGVAVQRQQLDDYPKMSYNGDTILIPQFIETLPSGRRFRTLDIDGGFGRLDNTKTFEVPAGHMFLLGDNRDNALDSRVDRVGFVPIDNVIGRIAFVPWSDDRTRIGASLR